jgi:hypothetical protein
LTPPFRSLNLGTSVETALPELRVRVPCDDEGHFHALLADHIAANGLRIPTERAVAASTHVTVALVFRNGRIRRWDGVVDGQVALDGRPGISVRLPALERYVDRFEGAPEVSPGRGPPPLPEPATRESMPAVEEIVPIEDEPLGGRPDAPGEDTLDEPLGGAPVFPPASSSAGDPLDASGLIAEAVNMRGIRLQRAALVVGALAVAVAGGGFVAIRHVVQEAAIGAQVQAADRLIAEGRLTGEEGAITRLLAARRIDPDDAATNARLAQVADLLEARAARALGRGDLAVASSHLAAAQLAAPDRPGIRAKLAELERRRQEDGPRPRRKRSGAR